MIYHNGIFFNFQISISHWPKNQVSIRLVSLDFLVLQSWYKINLELLSEQQVLKGVVYDSEESLLIF